VGKSVVQEKEIWGQPFGEGQLASEVATLGDDYRDPREVAGVKKGLISGHNNVDARSLSAGHDERSATLAPVSARENTDALAAIVEGSGQSSDDRSLSRSAPVEIAYRDDGVGQATGSTSVPTTSSAVDPQPGAGPKVP
jgi:hypothetical protein